MGNTGEEWLGWKSQVCFGKVDSGMLISCPGKQWICECADEADTWVRDQLVSPCELVDGAHSRKLPE